MATSLPEGAERAWFQDGSTMREGFIMPDGTKYMFDKYGRTIKVFLNNKPVTDDNTNNKQPIVFETRYQTYNVPAIVIGTILFIAGIYFLYDGWLLFQAQQNGLIEIIVGAIGAWVGFCVLTYYKT
jgi:hypothetical protein